MTDAPQTFAWGNQVEDEFGMSQGIRARETVYISGQYAHAGDGALLGEGDIATQLEHTLRRLDAVLSAFDAVRQQVVQTSIFIVGFEEHAAAVAEAHRTYFGAHRPATTVVGVAELVPGQLVEIAALVRLDLPR